MTYDRGFLRLTWRFSIINRDEIALTGLNFSTPDDPTFDPNVALGEINMPVLGPLLIARMGTLMATSPMRWADYSRLNSIRIGAVQTTGLETIEAKEAEDITPPAGASTEVLPQSSVVASLRSGFVTGAANFGRMFLPHSALPLATGTPETSSTVTGTVATAFQTFVSGVKTDLDAAVTAAVDPMIMTQVVGGTSKRVASIAVGDVNDTQRRRRNQLPEEYTFRSIP